MKASYLDRLSIPTLLAFAMLTASSNAATTNVALNKPVTLNGVFFDGAPVANLDTVTDGVFLPAETTWYVGTVWWINNSTYTGQSLQIDLLGTYQIESLIVQGDNNDVYDLMYWEMVSNTWQPLWSVPETDASGMQTRPDMNNVTARHVLPTPVTTNALKIHAASGDNLYAIGEIQAYGTAVPEPATLCLTLLGSVALLRHRRAA